MATRQKHDYSSSINSEILADIYLQLARMEDAGLSAEQAFSLLNTKTNIDKQKQQLCSYLQRGQSITESGVRSGVFSHQDKELLNAGEMFGNLGIVYGQLADSYEQKAKRTKKIKSQLFLPVLVFILAAFIQPFPALILNEISGLQYLFASFGEIFKTVLFLYTLIKIPFWLTEGSMKFLDLGQLIYQLQLRMPCLSSWFISRQINEFFRSLGLMLKAGIPVLEALPKAIDTIKNPLLRRQFSPVIPVIKNGQSLTESLSKVREIDRKAIQLILVGEKSGKLTETLLRYVKAENEKHSLQEQLLAEWLPRLFYFLVAGWVANSLMTANPFGNTLP